MSRAIYPDTTPLELRRELDYLADRKMVDLGEKPSGDWFADLTRLGVDPVEYTVECGPGIAARKSTGGEYGQTQHDEKRCRKACRRWLERALTWNPASAGNELESCCVSRVRHQQIGYPSLWTED